MRINSCSVACLHSILDPWHLHSLCGGGASLSRSLSFSLSNMCWVCADVWCRATEACESVSPVGAYMLKAHVLKP
jgi:hypothetical protein